MRKPKWQAKVFYLIIALAFALGLAPLAATTPVEARGGQTIRVYISTSPYDQKVFADFAKAGQTITFYGYVDGPVAPNDWVWNFGDGTGDWTGNPMTHEFLLHKPAEHATFEVSLTVSWTGGQGTAKKSIYVETGLIVEPMTYPVPDYYPGDYFYPAGIDSQTGYNVLTSTAIFFVPDYFRGKVIDWDVSGNGHQIRGGDLGYGQGYFDMPPGYDTLCEGDPDDTYMFDWVQVAQNDATEPGEVTVRAFIDLNGDCDTSLEGPLSGIKKWGDIDDTELQVMELDYDTGEWVYSECPGESDVLWYEGAGRIPLPYDTQYLEFQKEEVGVGWLSERVIGTFDRKPGFEPFEHPANGALVHMYLFNEAAGSDLEKLPQDEASGISADELLGKLDDLLEQYPPYPSVVGFNDGDPDPINGWDDEGDQRIHVTKVTTPLDLNGNGVIEDPDEMGWTGNMLVANGKVRVKVVFVATYPGDTGEELPVFVEICSWNFKSLPVEKVPQIHWAEEEVILEKQFGSIYNNTGDGKYEACFQILTGKDDAGLSPAPGGSSPTEDKICTPLDLNGVARCYLSCSAPTLVEVLCTLSEWDKIESVWVEINKATFVEIFLGLEEISLSNLQGEREGHNDGLWDPVLDSGVVEFAENVAVDGDIYGIIDDSTKDWDEDFVGKTLRVWKGEMEDDGNVTYWGDIQIGEIVYNDYDYVVAFPGFTKLPKPPTEDIQWYYDIVDPVWNPETDDLYQELNVSQDALLRARIKGWFTADNLPATNRPALPDPENPLYNIAPAGRYVLPDDWAHLAPDNWEEFGRHWDIMDQPNDNIMSEVDRCLKGWATAGDYLEWTLDENPNRLDIAGDLVAEWPVIGPYSTLDQYSPYIQEPWKIWWKTIVPNGKLNEWDCPMPPAEVFFEITEGPGFFKDCNKADVYYQWVETDLNEDGPDGIAYTNPYYWMWIPPWDLIPPIIVTGGYDWNSWNPAYGPYPFWKIVDAPDGEMPSDEQHPTKVEVYSDNHGEAMVWLNGDWNLDLEEWRVDKFGPHDAYDVPTGTIVGDTVVQATLVPPYQYMDTLLSNTVEKVWTWGKEIKGYSEWVRDSTSEKKVFVFVTDRDGMPAIGERIVWILEGSTNGGMIESYLEGTNGKGILGYPYPAGESFTREPTPDEAAAFEAKFGKPCHHGIAGIIVSSSLGAVVDMHIEFEEREGVIIRDVLLNFNQEPGAQDTWWTGAGDPPVDLAAGWNNVAWGDWATTPTVAAAVAPLGDTFVAMWYYDAFAAKWLAYSAEYAADPETAWVNDNFQMKFLSAYWIQVTEATTWYQGA